MLAITSQEYSPIDFSSLSRSSAAALFVNVMARILYGRTGLVAISFSCAKESFSPPFTAFSSACKVSSLTSPGKYSEL